MSKHMNIKYFAMSVIALSAILVTVNPANAQGKSARFDFAPQYYKLEEPKVPTMTHSVQHGSVPKGSNYLGIDPSMLPKKAQEQVAARPAFTTVTPKIEFNSAFGQPAIPPAEVKPMMAQAKSKPMKARPVVVAHRGHHTTSVNAKLVRKKAPSALDATPAQLASYDKNVGYAPGTYLPTTASDGYQRNANVHGKILKN